jgi:phosphate starvation-inducible PhoH-like protein
MLTPGQVHLHLQDSGIDELGEESGAAGQVQEIGIKTRIGIIRGRGPNQKKYLKNIVENAINFGVGPAGTGKTFLAVACAVGALQEDSVQRIVLVRPAVEAGERLGFLPGDLAQKVDPYLRPLYDALYEMLGFERVATLIDRNLIEVAPLAFMRGRTLHDAFVILDEAQNTTREQMKMFLTRIGFGSTAVVTGDVTQIDLPDKRMSGLIHALQILSGVKGISFCHFMASDVVRHPLVQHIVEAYEAASKHSDD